MEETRRSFFSVVAVDTGHGAATITGTAYHLYWDATTRSWTPAHQLRLGDHLQSTHGTHTTILALHDHTTTTITTITYNLTINTLHTYYVTAGTTPVLVHNEDCGVNFDPKQLQKKFKHAEDFGVTGNYSKATGQAFQEALQAQINDPETTPISGTYRGDPVTHYYSPSTGLDLIVDPEGNFVSGWRLGQAQTQNLLSHGGLN